MSIQVYVPISCPYCSQCQWHEDTLEIADACRCYKCGGIFLFNYKTVNYSHCVDGQPCPAGTNWVRRGPVGDCYAGISFEECKEKMAMSAAINELCLCKTDEDIKKWANLGE